MKSNLFYYYSFQPGHSWHPCRGEVHALQAGKRMVQSKSFPGSDRDVHARFMDGMTFVAWYERPDYFVTMTCNPYWPEIKEQLVRHRKTDQMLWQGSTMRNCWTSKISWSMRSTLAKLLLGLMWLSFRREVCHMSTFYWLWIRVVS